MEGKRFMHVRVTPVSFDASREQEINRWSNESFVPTLSRIAGFRGFYGALDRDAGRMVAITLWDTREQAENLRDNLSPKVLKEIRDLGSELKESQVYEVTVAELDGGAPGL